MDGILFQVAQTIEAMSPTCAAFADQDTFVTGSDDSLVRIWHLSHASPSTSTFVGSTTTKTRKGRDPSLTLVHLLRKHTAPIISLHVSRAWSVVISGSLDGSAILWDLNRGLYVRSIWHAGVDCSIEDAAVHIVAINESTVRWFSDDRGLILRSTRVTSRHVLPALSGCIPSMHARLRDWISHRAYPVHGCLV